jgi:FkbM family methyltransferase
MLLRIRMSNWNTVHSRKNTKLRIVDLGWRSWAFRTQEAGADKQALSDRGLVEASTLDKILSDHKIDVVDILKIDIEGAEKEVFENSAAWIDRVGVIVIELHDSFKAGSGKAVDSAANILRSVPATPELFPITLAVY